MLRLFTVVVCLLTATQAFATPPDSPVHALAVTKPTSDASVVVHPSKGEQEHPRQRCRFPTVPTYLTQTEGQYLVRRNPEGDSASMTLLHTLSTPTWVTSMARQLAELDEDAIDNEAVDIVLLLANDTSIELADVGLEIDQGDDGVVRAMTHVRMPRQGIDVLARSPVVQITWTVDGVDHVSSLSRRQGQRLYQQPFTCLADTLS